MVSFSEAVAAGKVTTEEATSLFDSLPPTKPGDLRGLWKGSSFPTGNSLDGSLENSGWFGKQFIDDNSVHPLLYNARGGGRFCADPVKVMALIGSGTFIPDVQSTCEVSEPKARIRVVEYRGVPTASMVYNELPVIDSFRKVDNGTLLGVMDNIRMPGPPFFFVLRRQAESASL